MPARSDRPAALIDLPIFWQVLGLSLFVLAAALGINTFLVLNAPDPPPAGYSISEAAQALKAGEVKLRNGRTLKAVTEKARPDFAGAASPIPLHGHFEKLVGQELAAALSSPADRVWVRIEAPLHMRHRQFETRIYVRHSASAGGPAAGGTIIDERGPIDDGGPMEGGDPPPGQMNRADMHGDGPPPQMMIMHSGILPNDLSIPPFEAAWQLADGSYRVITPPATLIQPWQVRLLIGFAVTALLILPLVWLLSQRLTRPIIAFSEAAAKVGFEDNAPPVMAIGSREVRAAADVLNAMQARIRKQMESRTALMGAIAHDLKTPLARMRLRIEDLPGPLRDKLGDDISHMDGLIKSAMSFTSAHRLGDTLRPLDLSALVEALADDMAAVCPIDATHVEHDIMVKGDTVALKRILTNLLENACRYAGSCRVEVSTRGAEVEVSVIDNGPGLPPEMLETVFEPFYRLEESRNRDTGGAGLGLSVAKALAEAQGGTLKLINRYEGKQVAGLEARLVLPRLLRA